MTAAALRERLGLVVERHELGLDLADLNNIACPVAGAARRVRRQRRPPPATTGRRSPTGWTACRPPWPATGRACGPRRGGRLARRRPGRCAPAIGAGPRSSPRPTGSSRRSPRAARTADGDAAARRGPGPPRGRRPRSAGAAYAELAGWLEAALLPVATDRDAVGRDLLRRARPRVPRHRRRPRRDVRLGPGGARPDRAPDGRRSPARLAPHAPGRRRPGAVQAAIAAGIAALDADPARRIAGRRSLPGLDAGALRPRRRAELGGTHFDIPEPVRTLRCRIAPSSSGAVYYTPPSEDFSRPGQMWWSVPAGTRLVLDLAGDLDRLPRGRSRPSPADAARPPTAADRLNRWRRLGCWVSGHGEGWALYAERLMEELGYLDGRGRPHGHARRARAARRAASSSTSACTAACAAPDEVGGGVWDAEKAWTFLRRHTRVPDAQLRFELERYLGWPGQAISYKVGERAWLDLREQARARDGAAFDLRELPPPRPRPRLGRARRAARRRVLSALRGAAVRSCSPRPRPPGGPPWSRAGVDAGRARLGGRRGRRRRPLRRDRRGGRRPRAGQGQGRGGRRARRRAGRRRSSSAATRSSSWRARCTASPGRAEPPRSAGGGCAAARACCTPGTGSSTPGRRRRRGTGAHARRGVLDDGALRRP